MPADVTLPLSATTSEISEAISRVQARCREHLADPGRLAHLVREQLDRVQVMATAVGQPVEYLYPSMQAWEGGSFIQTATVVHVEHSRIRVTRGAPWGTASSGRVHMDLRRLDEGGWR